MAQEFIVSKENFDDLAREIFVRKAAARQGMPADSLLEEDAKAAIRAAHMYFASFNEWTLEERKGGMK